MIGSKTKTEILFKEVNMNLTKIEGSITAIGDRVLVTDMDFGEQKTAGGLIIRSDDGTTRGIYPRWGKVYDKGPRNKDPYEIGDWILVEHGRWTRGVKLENNDETLDVRMVEAESILAWSDEQPNTGLRIGAEYNDTEHATVDPSAFVNSSGALAQ
jgi:co-chaperonin GroES (HSP10)